MTEKRPEAFRDIAPRRAPVRTFAGESAAALEREDLAEVPGVEGELAGDDPWASIEGRRVYARWKAFVAGLGADDE